MKKKEIKAMSLEDLEKYIESIEKEMLTYIHNKKGGYAS